MASRNSTIRNVRLQVVVSEELARKIDALCNESGLSRSAMCTSLLADAVRSRNSTDEFIKALPDSIAKIFSNPESVKVLSDNAPSV